MERDRWEQIERLYYAALEKSFNDVTAFRRESHMCD